MDAPQRNNPEESTKLCRKRERSKNNDTTFVWAKDGNHDTAKEHAAYLLQSCDVAQDDVGVGGDDDDEYVYVRWSSTGTISRILKSNISTEELSPRRCRRRHTATQTQVPHQKSCSPLARGKSRLSLSRKQRQHWKDYQQKVRCNEQKRLETNDHKDAARIRHYQLDDASIKMKHVVSSDVNDNDDSLGEKKVANAAIASKQQMFPRSYEPLVENGGLSAEEIKPQSQHQQRHHAAGVVEKKTVERSYTYRSSAYVQHIAEACHIVMTDGRWRTTKSSNSSKEIALFSWEEGDDLSAIMAFMSLYEGKTNQVVETQYNIENDVVFDRAMNLYSRIYHRKGPWFDLADLYARYYASHKVSGNPEEATETTTSSLSNQQASLQRLFVDIVRLEAMGLVRSFESEYECGTVAGQYSHSGSGGMTRGVLLSAEERREVLSMLGGGKSPKVAKESTKNYRSDCINEVLAQMQSQKTLFSAFAAAKSMTSKATSLLPVRKHVNKVLLRKLAKKVISLSKEKDEQVHTPKKAEMEAALQMIDSAWNDSTKDSDQQSQKNILSTIRLREAPLHTLRRVMRLFLCAGGGPGSMRGDGTNGWRSCLAKADSWHKVEYPGLHSRLGLESHPLHKYFAVVPEHEAASRVFRSLNEFRLFEIGAELRSSIDTSIVGYERCRKKEKEPMLSDTSAVEVPFADDVFNLRTNDGRYKFVCETLSYLNNSNNESAIMRICAKIEEDLHQLSANGESMSTNESLILHTSIICRWVIQFCSDNLNTSLSARPWLRHLSFDAILSYIIWDSIPFLERRCMYVMASSILMTILFGTEVQSFCFDVSDLSRSYQCQADQYAQYLLPRRNRGKAIERLLIDLTHAHRKSHNQSSNNSAHLDLSPIQGFCRYLLGNAATSCSIPFSSIRNLARRLKAPLVNTLKGISNDEMRILQIRLDDVNSNESRSCVGYRDWSAKTDVAIANALSNDTNGSAAGKRCAFVGWELCDDGNQPEITRSLNVEELALEEYHAGRLPNPSDENGESMIRGNWKGFHDEGGHIRKLFRIVFLHVVLENNAEEGDPTILLSPYQQSPNDLHVGYHKVKIVAHKTVSFIHGFYERRRNSIEKFLKSLSQQTDQDVSDLVYNCLKSRWDSHANDDSRVKDVQLAKDVSELRTLSMIAAGLGGQALSSIFRAFTFDYRHYSGGLPDLLLTRARYKSAANQFVDLGEWVGEAFCKDYIEEDNINRCISMLADRDDDFLGCSKNSDSGLFSSRKKMQKKVLIATTFPNKLQLLHNEKQVKVDCMFVEVKSVNDRLDARQEDWLNIIDKFADARVCKFVSKNQSK